MYSIDFEVEGITSFRSLPMPLVDVKIAVYNVVPFGY